MDILKQIIAISGGQGIAIAILVLVLANLISGIIVAVKKGTFRLSEIGDFLGKKVLPLVGGYYVLCITAYAVPAIQTAIVAGALTAVITTFLGFISINLKELGLPMPDAIGNKPVDHT